MKLTSEQITFFHERGYLRLHQALARDQWRPLQTRIADEMSRHGVSPSGRGLPRSIGELPVFQQIAQLSQLVKVPDLEAKVIPAHLKSIIDDLAQTKVTSSQSQLLISPPRQGDWSLDRLNWHTDISSPRQSRIPGIQAFVIVQDLESRGGATLVLSGSHLQMGNAQSATRIRDALGKGREGLGTLRELDLSIVEFSGKAGDVYLMDMRVLHTPSVNTSDRLRMVATVRFFLP